MIEFRPELYDVVKYYLKNPAFGEKEIPAPIGWESDLKEVKKSKKNFSVVTKYSTNIEFIGEGAEYIRDVYSTLGLEAQIELRKTAISETESKQDVVYTAFLNGYDFQDDGTKIKITSEENELNKIIATYEDEDIEIINPIAINGNDIGALDVKNVWVSGKHLNFISRWEDDKEEDISLGGNDFFEAIALPLIQTANSDEQSADVQGSASVGVSHFSLLFTPGQIFSAFTPYQSHLFYAIADDDIEWVNFEIDFDITVVRLVAGGFLGNSVKLVLATYEDKSATGGDLYEYKSEEILDSFSNLGGGVQQLTHYSKQTRSLLKGESMGIFLTVTGASGETTTVLRNKTNIVMEQDSIAEPTNTQAVLPFELFERLIRVMTGRTDLVLVSNYFGRTDLGYDEDGAGAYLGVSSGFWAREFYGDEHSPIISWKQAINSYYVTQGISFSIEKSFSKDYVKIEPLETEFFNNTIYKMPNAVDDLKIKIAKEFSFSALEIGYKKGGAEYEEAAGLDEPNGKHNYTTPITGNKKSLKLVSDFRADMTGFEFARRKPQKGWASTDTQYDSNIFLLDLKPSGVIADWYTLRDYNDDFAVIQNVYSAETATNLRLSPKQLLKKHGWFIKNCLTRMTDSYIHFTSSVGNSKMILDGVAEDGDFLISLLDRQKFINYEVEFTHKTNLDLANAISSNIYGIFEIVTDKGNVYQFRLFEFSKNKYKGILVNGI